MRALIVVAVRVEAEAVLDALLDGAPRRPVSFGRVSGSSATTPAGEVVVVAGGVGLAACAVSTATVLAHAELAGQFDVVLSAGIAGGFDGFPVGSVVVGARSVAADLGCDTDGAFLPLSQLGLGVDAYESPRQWADLVAERARSAGLPVCTGDINTVSTITGTARGAAAHSARHSSAAEAMEGFAVASAAALSGVPFVEVRAISNAVGPRDVSTWRIPDALAAVGTALSAIFKEPLPW
ncbi:MAG: mqnB [Frankiales bacterium]|nr:mqnB [Frankiales bacterium]